MINTIKQIVNKKVFHVMMIVIIVVVILSIFGIIILRYFVEGEKNMPFDLTKIVLISSSESVDKDSQEKKWAFDINQNNDIYIYLEKNKNYQEKEAIRDIRIDNINVSRDKEFGTIKFYRPNISDQGGTFANTDENAIENIEYKGAMESNLKNLEIANQGGIVVFRYALNNVAEYQSDDEEINHNELLKKANVNENDLKSKISFDFYITTESGKEYKTNMSFDMPVQGVVEKGTTSQEITDLSNYIFKRTRN